MQSAQLPELADDPTLAALIETFNARLVYEHNATHYRGALGMSVRIGEAEQYQLPHLFLHAPVPKWELEQVRAQQFATELLRMSREQMAGMGQAAAQYESPEWMGWVRDAYREQMQRMKGAAV